MRKIHSNEVIYSQSYEFIGQPTILVIKAPNCWYLEKIVNQSSDTHWTIQFPMPLVQSKTNRNTSYETLKPVTFLKTKETKLW